VVSEPTDLAESSPNVLNLAWLMLLL